jgi:hypothetical protein
VHELIDAANRAGGKDNVTVVVVEAEQFTAPVEEPRHRSNWLLPVLALVGLGLLAAAYAVLHTRTRPEPAARVPRNLLVDKRLELNTIRAALAQAIAGDTVLVGEGEYREQIVLKSGVSVIARPPRGAILRAAPLSTGPAVIASGIEGAFLSGFSIHADPAMPLSTGILLSNSSLAIEDTEVEGAGNGIEIHSDAGNTTYLVGNAVHDSTGTGILITGGRAQAWLSHNSLQRNKVAGLAVREGAQAALIGNVIEKNPLELPADMDLTALRERNFFLDVAPRRTVPRASKAEAKK